MNDKKKIAIIACAMALPGEKGYTRFSFLADLLGENNYKVDVYTSSFNHWEKAQRDTEKIEKIKQKVSYGVNIVHEPGYKKNVDLRRVVSHILLAKNAVKEIKKREYDLIYVIIPDNFLAANVTRYAKKNNIPVIIDIEDTWPEGMEMLFSVPIISNFFFLPLELRQEKHICLRMLLLGHQMSIGMFR